MIAKNKIGLTILYFFLLATAVRGQDYYNSSYDYKPVSFGITFAPHMDWLRYGETDGYESTAKFGYAYGLIADFAFSENYYFSSGLTINTINHEVTSQGPVPNQENGLRELSYRLQYAEIPLGLKLKSTQRYYRSYYGQFGFSAGFKLSGKEKETDVSGSKFVKTDADFFRLALQIGGGVEWLLDHNLRFMTGVTYNNGFTRALGAGDPRNSYLAVNLAIMF